MAVKVAVVGGGITGMMAAIAAGESGAEVVLYEKNPILGKKLTNSETEDFAYTHGGDVEQLLEGFSRGGEFLYPALSRFSNLDWIGYLEKLGLKSISVEGCFLPETGKPENLVNLLSEELKKASVEVKISTKVHDLLLLRKKIQGLAAHNLEAKYGRVILATGGLAKPKTGSTGDGLSFAEKLGHNIIPTLPGLVPLKIQEKLGNDLPGAVLQKVKITLSVDKERQESVFGEVKFVPGAIAGRTILAMSGKINRLLSESKSVEISLDLKPDTPREHLEEWFKSEAEKGLNVSVGDLLHTFIPGRMIPLVGRFSGARVYKGYFALSSLEKKALLIVVKDMRFHVTGSGSYHDALATSGGVDLSQVDIDTMESKLIKGLYFAGEILDLEGKTGAYNLQAAVSTAQAAGEAAGKAPKRTTKKKTSAKKTATSKRPKRVTRKTAATQPDST
jgi:predicted Rossmann fold flavoprotein